MIELNHRCISTVSSAPLLGIATFPCFAYSLLLENDSDASNALVMSICNEKSNIF